MIFLTQSRTAIFLYAFETAFLVSFILFIRKTIIKPLLIIISCSLFAFILCFITLKISNPEFKDNQTNLLQPVNFYINKNISSIYSKKERSNPERLALMTAHLKVGLEHPIFGVGIKMTDSYVIKKLSQNACNLPSIKEKILLAGKNIFKTDLPPLNHYINIFSSSGLSGLFIFLLPVVYIIYKIINNRYLLKNRKYICILIIVTTQMVAMLTTEAFLSFYISFGLLLCMTDNITEKHIKNNTKHNESNIF
ncbi:MAG: O-antigen ligase family protein [Endomicrobiaceae bacterium]|nr:O-antigen ligase family protein [Endomicrobiaceae bacterium]MDD3922824.1 O-antigen ligase family protein [Endomicrobiaceae bacterium]